MWKVLLSLIVMFVCPALASAVLAPQAKVLVSTPADLPQSALSPESCLSEIDELNAQAYREAIGSGQEVDRTGLRHRSKMIASKCASSYSFASVRQEQLPALSRLYFVADQPSRAYNAVSRYLKLPLISKTVKAELLLVHLTSPGKNVRFGIALPGFDAGELEGANQVTDWEGELPDTGDYNIAVFVKKGAGSYTLEVTIR